VSLVRRGVLFTYRCPLPKNTAIYWTFNAYDHPYAYIHINKCIDLFRMQFFVDV